MKILDKSRERKSFTVEVRTNRRDSRFYGSALRFATRDEAETYGHGLHRRWLLVIEQRVAESCEPVNYAFKEGALWIHGGPVRWTWAGYPVSGRSSDCPIVILEPHTDQASGSASLVNGLMRSLRPTVKWSAPSSSRCAPTRSQNATRMNLPVSQLKAILPRPP